MRGLFRRVFLVNVAVLLASSALLVFSPVTVSAPIVATEVAVLGAGLLTALLLNALLLRASLRPLDGLSGADGAGRPAASRGASRGHGHR